ncbi:conserved hypothetical protein [Ricinus communis]|uniref:Secreted protein n=1 Tax=Ricinus communis TaxID=3988 RepID=B9RNL0_RICCO|nr:conserved hypothetical protein [Ricinus communis]
MLGHHWLHAAPRVSIRICLVVLLMESHDIQLTDYLSAYYADNYRGGGGGGGGRGRRSLISVSLSFVVLP